MAASSPTTDTLARNLAALARHEPELAQRLRDTAPAALNLAPSKSGPLTASLDQPGKRPVALASRYDPLAEADKLIAAADPAAHPTLVVVGFGLGHHAAQLAAKLSPSNLLILFEPDESLLRAALEHVDHSQWLSKTHVVFFTGRPDRSVLSQRLEKRAALITQGLHMVAHPPTRQLHGEAIAEFGQHLTDTVAFLRTVVATTLVNAARTGFNHANNLPHYAAGQTINDLKDAAQGCPAVCVAAGPSLVKNIDLLCDAAVRDKVVVIAVQTALKPLLDRGIRPDFVTALDYSEICRRFYESLPPLPDVTLVVEPKVHPVVLDSYPGPTRLTKAGFNDTLLGDLARPIDAVPAGATVAHLSFYLAQYLGCRTILLLGQDLGFSDGLYYCPGTAVHDVWSSEMNPFNTVEMMEWQRIVRHKGHLSRHEDVHGRPIFSDEQMVTYLKQFERDFAQAEADGYTVIDCTEGGMAKAHCQRMTLAQAIEQHATQPVPELPKAEGGLDRIRLKQVYQRVQQRRDEIAELRQLTQRSIAVLRDMLAHQRDPSKMEKLFAQMEKNKARIDSDLNTAFATVQSLNTLGAYRRMKADHHISLDEGDAYAKQRRQIERDRENLEWIVQACDEALEIFNTAVERTEQFVQQDAAGAVVVKPRPEAVASR